MGAENKWWKRELKRNVFKRWMRQVAEGGREWTFRVKERVGGSSGGRQQGYTVKIGRVRERERACLWRNVTMFSVWEMGKTDFTIPVGEEGWEGDQQRTSATKADISLSLHQQCQLVSSWKWFVHSDPHSFGKQSSSGSDCDSGGKLTIMEVSHFQPDMMDGYGCLTRCDRGQMMAQTQWVWFVKWSCLGVDYFM